MSREDSKRDMRRSDVVGVGCCVLDELLLVDRYPVVGAETAIRVKEYSLQGGGPAATAMAAAARLVRGRGSSGRSVTTTAAGASAGGSMRAAWISPASSSFRASAPRCRSSASTPRPASGVS